MILIRSTNRNTALLTTPAAPINHEGQVAIFAGQFIVGNQLVLFTEIAVGISLITRASTVVGRYDDNELD